MTVYYVWSGAGGSGTGTDWANAFTTLTLALATEAAGDTLYVAHDHAESTNATLQFTSSGTVSNPTKVICANRAGSVPPVAADLRATAQVLMTGNFTMGFAGFTHYDGIIFIAGNSTGISNITWSTSNSQWSRFDNCSLRLGSTGTGKMTFQEQGNYLELNNTTLSFSNVAQTVELSSVLKWRNTASALIGTAVPTTLITIPGSDGGECECIGVDFSAAGSGKTICGTVATANAVKFRFMDCKLNASVTKSTVPAAMGATEVDFIRTGSSGVNYAVFRHRVQGTLNEETTIVRTAGANDGTTTIAWNITTTANCSYSMPFECPPIAIWNDTTGSSVTATVEGIWGGGAVPNDDDVWLDVEYLGDASSPLASFVNDGKASLGTAAGQTSSSESWGGSTTKFKLAVSFTAQQKGWIYARVKCAKTSSTFYIDPLVTLT